MKCTLLHPCGCEGLGCHAHMIYIWHWRTCIILYPWPGNRVDWNFLRIFRKDNMKRNSTCKHTTLPWAVVPGSWHQSGSGPLFNAYIGERGEPKTHEPCQKGWGRHIYSPSRLHCDVVTRLVIALDLDIHLLIGQNYSYHTASGRMLSQHIRELTSVNNTHPIINDPLNHLFIPKLKRLCHWSLLMDKLFHSHAL